MLTELQRSYKHDSTFLDVKSGTLRSLIYFKRFSLIVSKTPGRHLGTAYRNDKQMLVVTLFSRRGVRLQLHKYVWASYVECITKQFVHPASETSYTVAE